MGLCAIDKLMQRPTFGSALVQQAMQEAKTDPKAQQQLQTLVDQRAADFEDPTQIDHCVKLLGELSKDTFELVPNRQTGSVGAPHVLEARITKVKDEARRVDITPPPPAPPVYNRDPLNITGKAPANSKVEFYNASVPGRPVLGNVRADASGAFNYELTDETKFKFGDQIGVRLSTSAGVQGRPLIVPTEPFLITNTATTYFTRSGGVETDVRTDHSSRHEPLAKNTDERAPFFQSQLVTPKLDVPSQVEQPYLFTLLGGDDAVEPNSTIKITLGRDVFQTKTDDRGQFALKVSGVIPGQRLLIEVRDLNGNGVDIPARVPPILLPQTRLLQGMALSDNGLQIDVLGVVPPGGALIVRNAGTGVVNEVVADKNGKLSGNVAGLAAFDAFEVAIRDVNGHVSEEAALFVSLPVSKGKTAVVAASSLNTKEPDLVRALQNAVGPPVDLVVNGQTKPGGPYLPLPTLPKLPPFAVLEVLKDGAVVQTFRAEANGSLEGLLRGVHVGDALAFRLRDAAGRAFPTQIDGFVVPDGACGSKVFGAVPPRLQPLDARAVGGGALTLDPEWLAPAKILVGKSAPTDFIARHAVVSSVGGALLNAPQAAFMAEHFPQATLADGASLAVTHRPGQKWVAVDVPGVTTGAVSFGYDDIHNTLQGLTEQTLPQLQQALQGAVAVVGAAYAQGQEPGDVGYDRALGVAKTLMFFLDRFCIENAANPTAVKAAQQVASDVLGSKRFALELTPRDVVGDGPQVAVEATSSRSINLLQARTYALGAIDGSSIDGPDRRAVDLAKLSAAASFDGKTLRFDGAGIIAAGDELVVKVGDDVHTFVAGKGGAVSASMPMTSGAVIEVAQRRAGADNDASLSNPIGRAVVVAQPILGEGHMVAFDALVQRAPAAHDVVKAVFSGTPVKGLPPGGSIEIVNGDAVVRVAVDHLGQLGKLKGAAVKDGDVVDVRVLDAAGRAFAPVAVGVVAGANAANTGQAKIDVDALTIAGVLEHLGTGTLTLPKFPKGAAARETPQEASIELNPFHGPSSSLESSGGRYRTQAAVPAGLLPDLAAGPGERRFMGDSVSLSACQWADGTINVSAGYYVDNKRPDFDFTFNEKTGELRGRFAGNASWDVVTGMSTLTSFLQTSLAFVAVAHKVGSAPGDGFYDLAARSAKSALVVCDHLIAKNPTYRTEILAAVRAVIPAGMPFDVAPEANTATTAQQAQTDRLPTKQQAFWNAVNHHDREVEMKKGRAGDVDVDLDGLWPRPLNFNATRVQSVVVAPATKPFFGGGSLASMAAQSSAQSTSQSTPLFTRTLQR